MEVCWLPIMDPWKMCVYLIISGERLLTGSIIVAGSGESLSTIWFVVPRLIPIATYSSPVPLS